MVPISYCRFGLADRVPSEADRIVVDAKILSFPQRLAGRTCDNRRFVKRTVLSTVTNISVLSGVTSGQHRVIVVLVAGDPCRTGRIG